MTVCIATKNIGKMQEFTFLFHEFLPAARDVKLVGLNEYPALAPVEEDGLTFLENARKKALHAAGHTGLLSVADDSGLEVDALDGAPGIYSARYAGPRATDDENMRKLLAALQDVPADRRTARFVCVIAVALPGDVLGLFEGVTHGQIAAAPAGTSGFGYDPLFVKLDYAKTFAQLPHDVKNRISHRARAFEKATSILDRYLDRLRAESRQDTP